jgi:hypothetical protein
MRRVAAACLFVLLTSSSAAAHLVEITTSVAVTGDEDRNTLATAVMTAVDSALKDAIAFTPTLVVLTDATMVGDRLYLRLLVADQEGERTFDLLNAPKPPEKVELRI